MDTHRENLKALAQNEAGPRGAAASLIVGGWYQVSRRWRTLARLPDGKTGIQALAEAADGEVARDSRDWAKMLGERQAGDHFLRVYARGMGLWREVSADVFREFRNLGGGTYADTARRIAEGDDG